jgi:hypothetical protein
MTFPTAQGVMFSGVLKPKCPAAEALAGPPMSGPSVVCRVMAAEDARADSILEGMVGGRLITDLDQGTILRGFCCGPGLPRFTDTDKPRGHYTFCPVWEAAEAAERQRKEADGRAFAAPEKPKILGEDIEVKADLLGLDPEQLQREEKRFYDEHPQAKEALGGEILTGEEAMVDVATDDEWKEES